MAAKAPLAMAVIKEQLRVLSDEVPIAAQTFERLQDMRRMVYDSEDYREGWRPSTRSGRRASPDAEGKTA